MTLLANALLTNRRTGVALLGQLTSDMTPPYPVAGVGEIPTYEWATDGGADIQPGDIWDADGSYYTLEVRDMSGELESAVFAKLVRRRTAGGGIALPVNESISFRTADGQVTTAPIPAFVQPLADMEQLWAQTGQIQYGYMITVDPRLAVYPWTSGAASNAGPGSAAPHFPSTVRKGRARLGVGEAQEEVHITDVTGSGPYVTTLMRPLDASHNGDSLWPAVWGGDTLIWRGLRTGEITVTRAERMRDPLDRLVLRTQDPNN